MNTQENKNFIDLGSDPIGDDFDPFSSDEELDAKIPAATPASQQQKPTTAPVAANPLETAINKAEDKAAEKAQQGQPVTDSNSATRLGNSICGHNFLSD